MSVNSGVNRARNYRVQTSKMGTSLSKAPVYFVAAQIRHNPIDLLVLDEVLLARIKDALRKLGFSDQAQIDNALRIEQGGANVEFSQPKQFLFKNRDSTEAVCISFDRILYQTTAYSDFEQFKSTFLNALAVIHQIAELDYVDAVSMRMLDAIVPTDGKDLQDYLPIELLGLTTWADERSWQIIHQSIEHAFDSNENRIVLRCIRRPAEIAFPPNFLPLGMKLRPEFATLNTRHAVLDTDAAFSARFRFDLNEIESHLLSIKNDLSQCFKNIVTPQALEEWK